MLKEGHTQPMSLEKSLIAQNNKSPKFYDVITEKNYINKQWSGNSFQVAKIYRREF